MGEVAIPLAADQLRELLSVPEQELFDLLNFVRADPANFAKRLEEEILPIIGDDAILRYPGAKTVIQTKEGKAAVQEAIEELRELSKVEEPLKQLNISHGLLLGAQDHLGDQWMDQNGFTGHNGSDGSNCRSRAERYGTWKLSIGESLCYGEISTFRIVAKWIIDDGIEKRTNRKNILSGESKHLGLAMGAHRGQGNCVVLVIAQFYENNQEKIDERNPVSAKDYKSARKRNFYKKAKTTTKTKTTTTSWDPNKRNCRIM